MKFTIAPKSENFPILRFVSEGGINEVGLTPMIYGVRVRAGAVGATLVDIDYCAGADMEFQMRLLETLIAILETFPEGVSLREINTQLPTYKVRPIDKDPCWPALQKMAEERTRERTKVNEETVALLKALEFSPGRNETTVTKT